MQHCKQPFYLVEGKTDRESDLPKVTQLLDTKLGPEVRFLFSLSQTWHHLPDFLGLKPHAGALCFQSDTHRMF